MNLLNTALRYSWVRTMPYHVYSYQTISIHNLVLQRYNFSSVQLLSCVRPFVTPWTAGLQASLSFTTYQSLLKLMSIESVMPSNHLTLCRPLLLLPSNFPSIRVFSNESALCISGQSIGVSTSTSVLPVNIQDWFLLGLTGLISLKSKGLSTVFFIIVNLN